jgi:hypothetical protein
MSTTEYPRNAILSSDDPTNFAPFSDEARDAWIEALRYAFAELTTSLHEAGVLDLKDLAAGMGNAEWLFANRPALLNAVRWLSNDMMYRRAKLGPAPRPDADNSPSTRNR